MVHVILKKNLSILHRLQRADKDERHYVPGRLVLLVTFDFDSNHARLVDNLLDDAPIAADGLSDKRTRNIDASVGKLEKGARLVKPFDRLTANEECAGRVVIGVENFNGHNALDLASILNVGAVAANSQAHQVLRHQNASLVEAVTVGVGDSRGGL